ncbi:MAG: TatD family hydrolase [Magnetococcales bacterium]|nr:TatD family hydrolase [Magnetococcales bacterium]
MIDTHCHLDLAVFDEDRAAVMERSRQAGVVQWVVPALSLAHFPALVALRTPELHVALGLHPLFIHDHPDDGIGQLAQWVARIQPVALGEIGLDATAPNQERQQKLFAAQLDLAREARLPVLLHVRKCHEPVLALLQRTAFSCGGIVHAFNGSVQQAHRYLAMGFRLGMGGVVTHEAAVRIRQMAREVPEEALVLESDAPDLPPVGHRGERNEPCHLPLVVQALAALRQVSQARIVETTTHNARATLGLADLRRAE